MIDTSRNMLYHIGNLNTESQRISYQMATGKNQEKGSEDSLLHADIIRIEDKIRVTENLRVQIVKSNAVNNVADSSMAEMKLALDSVKIDIMKGLNSGMQRSDKLALATNLRGIRDNMYDLMNVRVDGEYVFAGSVTTEQTMVKDPDFADNGKVEFGGDGFLRKIAVQPGSYRERGVTGYDIGFYPATKTHAGEQIVFEEGERIIDQDGFEWKMNAAKDKLQKYDHNGIIYHPPVEYDVQLKTAEFDAFDPAHPDPNYTTYPQSQKAVYETVNPLPASEPGLVFKSMHNYFDDLNVMINALEGYATNIDGTKDLGTPMSDLEVNDTLRRGLTQTSLQFDATNVGHGELGGRNKTFEVAYEKLESQLTHYNILQQETNGADLTKLAMESKRLEMTYQSLYATISKMNEMSLVNFIR